MKTTDQSHGIKETDMNDTTTLLQQLLADLQSIGFGTDEPIDGADVIDVINLHYEDLRQLVEKSHENI